MHEEVFAGLGGDEAKALVGVEPFHGSNRHVLVPRHRLGGSTHVDVTLTPTARDKLDLRVAGQNVNLCRAHGDGTAIVRHHRAHGRRCPRSRGCPPSAARWSTGPGGRRTPAPCLALVGPGPLTVAADVPDHIVGQALVHPGGVAPLHILEALPDVVTLGCSWWVMAAFLSQGGSVPGRRGVDLGLRPAGKLVPT